MTRLKTSFMALGLLGTLISFAVWPSLGMAELLGNQAVSVGANHTCVVTTGGGVKCWGINLGDGTATTLLTAVDATGLSTGIQAVALGEMYSCALTTAGGVKCWGSNLYGKLGDGSTTYRTTAVDSTGLSIGIQALSLGWNHTCALTTAGGVKCWGFNLYNQLGDGSSLDRYTAVDSTGLQAGIKAIAAGAEHTCAMTTSGGVKCWGRNSAGQLGDGTTTIRATAIDTTGLSTGVKAIAAGGGHTCALTTAGGVKCWGGNGTGQLGDGTTTNRTTAVDSTGLATGIQSISLGYNSTCALTTAGGVKCFGQNDYGQLGDGTNSNRTTAVDISGLSTGIQAVALGGFHACALNAAGGVECWGRNNVGQLGDGSTDKRTEAVNTTGLATGMQSIAAATYHTCALTTAGGAKCWGNNFFSQLGDGTTTTRTTAIDVTGLSSGLHAITAGVYHTCAMTTAGGVKCWGQNNSGQLGDNSTTTQATAVNVVGLATGVQSIGARNFHTCAITTAGGAECWGLNDSFQLGDGSPTNRTTPVNVVGLATGMQAISLGFAHTCALTTAGGVKCWGGNTTGQLGDGTTTIRTTPVDSTGLQTGIQAIALGAYHTCALTTAGGVRCWGHNSYGQLGDGTTTWRSSAVNVAGLLTGVQAIAANGNHTCALTTAGGMKCWGTNINGQLGDGYTTDRTTAVDVVGLATGVQSLALGHSHTCALTTVGGVKCWGLNSDYQLGDASMFSIRTALRGLSAQGIVNLSGSPLSGVTLRATGMGALYASQESTTNGSGNYILPIVETAPYTITPELAGYTFAPPSLSGTMASDFTQDFVATLITYNITGTVTANASPLAGATVDGGALGNATTDASGAYSFTGVLPATPYTLTVSHPGATFGVNSASGTLNSHATHDFSGTLNTYNITGTITAGGNPLAGVSVDGGGLGVTTTDGSGAYSFSGVNYGTVYVITPSLTDYDFSPVSAGATLAGNATHDFTGVYNPPTTTSVATTSVVTTTVATSSVATTTVATTTVPTSTVTSGTTSAPLTSTLQTTSVGASTTTEEGTTSQPTTTIATTTTETTTTAPPEDSDGDGLTDAEEEAQNTDPEDADSDDDGVSDSEEVTTGTNPNDPGSKSPKLRTTICSDWNGYLGGSTGRGMYNIMEHINLTTKKLRVKTELRNIRGHLKDTYEFFLRGNQQFDLLVHDMSGRESNSYGQVCTTYTRAPAGSLDGRMVYYKFGSKAGSNAEGNSAIEFAFALPFENPSIGTSALLYNTMQPSLDPNDTGNLVANWVQLSNVSKKRLKGKLYFHKLDGTQLSKPVVNPELVEGELVEGELVEVDVNLRDGARYDYSAHAYGANRAGLIRFVPADKTVEYQLRQVRYLYDNSGTEDSFASAYPFGAQVGSGQTLIAPIDATASSAILELANPSSTKVNANIKLYDRTGKKLRYSKTHSLKAYSTEHLQLDSYLSGAEGVLIVKGSAAKGSSKSNNAGALVGNAVHYGRTATGGVKNMYATPLREPIGKSMKGSYNTYLNQGCTLYLTNAASAKETVTISLKQSDGTSPVADYKRVVPARGLLAENLCSVLPANVYGVVTVSAPHAKRISATIVRVGDDGRYKMATELR